MKNIFKNSLYISGILCILAINACKESIDPVIDELSFTRAFTPNDLNAQISDVTTVTLTWSAVKNTSHYVVEIYQGVDFVQAALVHTADVDSSQLTYQYVLPAGDTQFSARLKSVSANEGVEDSKWTNVEFRSLPENLFDGYKTEMTGIGSITVRWSPGETVTGLVFDDGSNEIPYTISADEMAAGEKSLTGVPNAHYEIRLVNMTFTRGRINYTLEGDAILTTGGSLNEALDALPAGGVLILTNGENYFLTRVDTVDLSIKIRGLYPDNLPKIFLITGGGNHMFDIGSTMTLTDSLVFENVDISCAYDDNPGTRHRGLIDQENTPFAIGAIKFNNCIIRNSGRSAIRLRGNAAGQVINNTEFNNCIMYDFAFDSHYGVLNGALTGNFINVKFSNSTVYNIRGGILNYGNGAGCQNVILDNCTFDRTVMDATTARFFIDFGTGGNTSTGTINVSDCIFGSTSLISNGIRNSNMTLTINGSYFTNDFVNVANSITSMLTAYSGASTSLWTNPSAGDFTFLDTNFPGKQTSGDSRWWP
ncbi:MAG: DUF5123 domain-containing protein [Bacteroidales bacterium]